MKNKIAFIFFIFLFFHNSVNAHDLESIEGAWFPEDKYTYYLEGEKFLAHANLRSVNNEVIPLVYHDIFGFTVITTEYSLVLTFSKEGRFFYQNQGNLDYFTNIYFENNEFKLEDENYEWYITLIDDDLIKITVSVK